MMMTSEPQIWIFNILIECSYFEVLLIFKALMKHKPLEK